MTARSRRTIAVLENIMTRLSRELNQLLYERNTAEAEVAELQVAMCMYESARARVRDRGRDRMRVSAALYAYAYLAFLYMPTNHSSMLLTARLTRVQLESLMSFNCKV